ncbi:hypothetical protein BGW36DRAFT_456964 [Talaromyces proteolyticus]|uniref:Uncharacterized protein n=1 Tax=Talaromyces proteolyticus TaxID=1131652 RepID=A0AAD4Q6D2_9EURO|nr:uncharacterized protein BGW36DRAFT_456964 [Talaromyces proteolyticus]KAH8705523.1 hypothetical protein BGW36DRAFT_456964 [Talaromyces proteolyticus]
MSALEEEYPTQADLNHSSREHRTKAWEHLLVGKTILFPDVPVYPDVPVAENKYRTYIDSSILPENCRVIGVGYLELLDYDTDRLTIEVDGSEVVIEVSFR